MKKTTILASILLMMSAVSTYAQEYLHINTSDGTQIYPLDDIDYIGLQEATKLSEKISSDSKISIFNAALEATGLNKMLGADAVDYSYDASKYSNYTYRSDFWSEIAVPPHCKIKGYTLFVESDEVLKKHGVNNLQDLQALAKKIYDETYPEDAGLYDTDLTNPKNPLYRFVAYHILTSDIHNLDRLTGRILNNWAINGELGVRTDLINPVEWYRTLLPNTMMKCERLTMKDLMGETCHLNNYYLNRRWDDKCQLRGSEVAQPQVENAVVNGRYFYVDDIVAFTPDVRDVVQNTLIRMDVSALFPELTTLDIRLNGDPMTDDNSSTPDMSFKNGKNFWFPNGSIDGLMVHSGTVVYRRPHFNFWSYQGDEFNVFGNQDIEISLPPVPFPGEWQVRLGFCASGVRGVFQISFDGVEQDGPINMAQNLSDYLSSLGYYDGMTNEQKLAEQKQLKSKGVYRAPKGICYGSQSSFTDVPQTYRRVLCQVQMDNTKQHVLRIKCVGDSNRELMLDYIELVPKSVYDVPEGQMESDL